MTTTHLQLTAHDPIVARDGRPFGVGQGYRMKGLGWPYPSVVAGSFRAALVKANGRDFSGTTPAELLKIAVAGVFPVVGDVLYLPAPNDCVVHLETGQLRVYPQPAGEGGCDFPAGGLLPVMLTEEQAKDDFKPKEAPAWWPADKLADWLTQKAVTFGNTFLSRAKSEVRDHVCIEPNTGAAAESLLFAAVGLSLTHLPRFGVEKGLFAERYTPITLSARVEADGGGVSTLNMLHPLGGERRLVHWKANGNANLWQCPPTVKGALTATRKVRMMLATPAVFCHGWRPKWIDKDTLEGSPPGSTVGLKLVGVCIPRWMAVSGWSLQPQDDPDQLGRKIKPGPKPIKRLVPAGGVYFFKAVGGDPASLADRWLKPVSDDPQDRNDGFGLAVWGTW